MQDYLKELIAFGRWRIGLALLLLFSSGLTESLGLFLLVPLLQVLGMQDGPAAVSPVVSYITQSLRTLGLPLTLPAMLTVFLLLVALRGVLMRWREILLTELRLGFVDHLRIRLYRALATARWQFLASRKGSDINHVLNADIDRVGDGTYFLLDGAVNGFMGAVQITVAFLLAPLVTLLALAIGALLLLFLKPFNKRSKDLGQALTETNRAVFSEVSEFLQGLKLVKSYNIEARHLQSFEHSVTALRDKILDYTRSYAMARLLYQLGGALSLSILLYSAISIAQLSGAELLVLILVFSRLLPVLSRLQQDYQHLLHMLPAYESAQTLRDQCEEAAEPALGSDPAPELRQSIRLASVSFHYDKPHQNILERIDLELPARWTTALVGPSGAGKSTLADILLGLLTPTEGRILLDGRVLNAAEVRRWRQAVAYVPQDTFLFHDTVRANLLWTTPEASEAELWASLRMAAANGFVRALPEGLDTVLGDRGIRLSGGERQRLALARALLRKPTLLLLDEATSALDSEHEQRIQEAIDRLHGELTIVLIAHRLSTVRHADRIVVMDGGRIVQQGTWAELSSNQWGRFYELQRAGGLA